LELIHPQPGEVVVDATLGSGGHAASILKCLGLSGRLIGIDQDPEAVRRARENLKSFSSVEYYQENFSRLDEILDRLNLRVVDAVLLDVGVSREQLQTPERGFSFAEEGPLDMRMGGPSGETAADLVKDLSQGELEELFKRYGEERWAGRIARVICQARGRQPIVTRVGPWDERFFIWFEDVDYCWRVREAGYQVWYLADVSCQDAVGRSFAQVSTARKQRLFTQSMARYFGKWSAWWQAAIIWTLRPLAIALGALADLMQSKRP